ncbi:MAG TPA: hypothetical protein VM290_01530 [Gaiellaceae bacterium]|nr:hypothetical protein [Gaiellaceae bacterium]
MPGGNEADLYRLAFEEAVRGLSQQQSALDNFRTRAGLLVSAAAIATSFLGGQALAGGGFTWLSWLAVALFVGVGASALFILWPRKDWEFVAGPRRLIATYAETENPLPLEEVHRDLALHMEDSYDANAVRLQRLVVALRLGSLFLAGEVLAWVVAIAVGG